MWRIYIINYKYSKSWIIRRSDEKIYNKLNCISLLLNVLILGGQNLHD